MLSEGSTAHTPDNATLSSLTKAKSYKLAPRDHPETGHSLPASLGTILVRDGMREITSTNVEFDIRLGFGARFPDNNKRNCYFII